MLLAEQEHAHSERNEEMNSPFNKFRNEEEMLNYYELKAVDVGDNFEEVDSEEEDDPFFYEHNKK